MNRSTKRTFILGWLSASTAVLLTASSAFAQDATVGVGATTTIPSRTRMTEPGEREPTGARAAPVGNAHDAVVGHLGVGWLGTADVPVGPSSLPGFAPLPAPIVGVRYWTSSVIGIDAGIGFFSTSSATRLEAPGTPSTTTEGPSRTAILLHAGVPIALADMGNFSFQLTPEFNVGIGTGGIKGTGGAANTELSGLLIEAGARAGAEVFFGFIGIPQLSLEGSVGLFLSSETGRTSQAGNATRFSRFMISSSSVAQPWDIFRKDIAARYYF